MEQTSEDTAPRRIRFFDSLRGLTIVSMVAFHATYDAAFLFGYDVPWFTTGHLIDIWRASISWTFLLIAGWMTGLSRNNVRRAGNYLLAAFAVWFATTVAAVDTPINFGIVFCMGASTLIAALAHKQLDKIPASAGLVACLLLFAFTYQLPHRIYPIAGLAWAGLPDANFASGDYYPLMPFAFMYLAGMFARRWFESRFESYPAWMYRAKVPVISAIGKLSLPIYLVHQPLLLVIFQILNGL